MIDPQICTKCKTRNPVGNKFCRECGDKLPIPENNPLIQEELERAERERRQERVAFLLSKAFDKSDIRDYVGALTLAEEAIGILPDSPAALNLLATLYQRNGQREKAIATMEQLVALNPDSPADRAKLEQLRRGGYIVQAAREVEEEKEKRTLFWVPLIAAGAVMALVFGILVSLGRSSGKEQEAPQASITSPYTPGYPQAIQGVATPQSAYAPPTTPNPIVTPYPVSQLNPTPSPAAPVTRPSGSSNRTEGTTTNRRLPLPGSILPDAGTVPPVTLSPPPPGTVTNVGANTPNGFGSGGRLPVGPPNGDTSEPSAGNPAPGRTVEMNTPNGGYIKIEVGNPNKESGTDSSQSNPPPPARDVTANPSPSSTESPVAKARRLQAEGRYSEAIAAYREAIGQGRTDGDTYLGIAQSYHRLGDSGAARGAYYDAIRAYESQIAAGRSTNAAQQGIVTCRAALELIGN